MIDNYDSFVYNLVRYFIELGQEIIVYRNDEITIDLIEHLQPEGIILSPGPKTPNEAGMSIQIIEVFKGRIPILGICLGHQAIAQVFGASIVHGNSPMHGKLSEVFHDEKGIFMNLEQGVLVTRYHSLVVDKKTIPSCLEVSCETKDGVIMGIRHKEYNIEGLQFHPEAELTQHGHAMIHNYIDMCKKESSLR
jgi:anthranilate synthase/aminodeoxychorismate synthase-like glutamine amidotransferase